MESDRRVGYQLKRVQQGLRASMDTALAALELTSPQYAVLAQLQANAGASNADLARLAFVTPQTMIRIVSQLEGKGLVERSPDPDDARRKQTHLTEEGRGRVQQAHHIVDQIEQQMTDGLDEGERTALHELLRRCARNLESVE